MLDLCLDSISFLEKVKQKFIMSSRIIGPLLKKKVSPSERVTPSEEVEKGSNFFIIWKSQCSRSVESIWVNFRGSIQHQQVCLIFIMSGLKKFSTLEPDFYKNFLELILKVKILKHIKPL